MLQHCTQLQMQVHVLTFELIGVKDNKEIGLEPKHFICKLLKINILHVY